MLTSLVLFFVFFAITFAAMSYGPGMAKAIARRYNRNPDYTYSPTIKRRCEAALFWAVAAMWLSPLYYEYPVKEARVVTFKNGAPVVHRFGTFCLEFVGHCVNVPSGRVGVVDNVTSLTENPKVRKIGYVVAAEVVSLERYYSNEARKRARTAYGDIPKPEENLATNSDFDNGDGAWAHVAKAVSYHMFRFKSEHSKDLSAFDNPLDPAQNERLRALLEGYLNPRLESDGIKVRFERFTVE